MLVCFRFKHKLWIVYCGSQRSACCGGRPGVPAKVHSIGGRVGSGGEWPVLWSRSVLSCPAKVRLGLSSRSPLSLSDQSLLWLIDWSPFFTVGQCPFFWAVRVHLSKVHLGCLWLVGRGTTPTPKTYKFATALAIWQLLSFVGPYVRPA